MTEIATTAPISEQEVESLSQAYERVKEKIQQVKDADGLHITLDVPTAVTTAVGSLSEIRALRAAMLSALPGFDFAAFDELETYAYALLFLHTRWTFITNPPDVLPELLQKAQVLRDLLVSHVTTLSKHGLLDGSVLKDLKGPVGYKNMAVDLAGMVGVLRESWDKIAGKTALSAADLDAADKLVKELFKAIGAKEQAPVMQAAITLERQRAFKLFVDTYSQARRAVTYLRWREEDVDQIAPSLYSGRGAGGRRKAEPAAGQNTPPASTPAPSGPAPAAPQAPAAPAGHPDSDPFTA